MISRRRFLQSSLSVALVPLLPRVAVSADLRVRQSWDAFCAGPTYASLCNAVSLMRANKNSSDPASWSYWPAVHNTYCPHGKPYFLAWHRGFLYRFEGWLRKVSGDPNLVLPYWNYYANPQVPAQFLDPTSSLYHSGRTGSDVSGALTLAPFADNIINFQRGLSDAFEPTLESAPHNPVHNLIGGIMSSVHYSPWDPLFWVHHASIDRLWAAWIAAGGGRHQPAATNSYWNISFQYGAAIKPVPGVWTTTTTNYFGYQYDDQTMPTSLPPPPPATSTAVASSTTLAGALPSKPAAIAGPPLGSSQPLALDERSLSVDVALNAQAAASVRSAMLQPAGAGTANSGPVCVVLDDVHLTGLGEKGGYFYKVYINLPDSTASAAHERAYLLGMVGPFEISVAQMKAAMQGGSMQGMQDMHAGSKGPRLEFPATEALRRQWPTQLNKLSVSFVRVDGSKHPTKGQTIRIGAFSVVAAPAK